MTSLKILSFAIFLVCNFSGAQTQGYATNKDASKTYYKIYGKGKPLLIINGGPGMDCNSFEIIAKQLSKNNKVILYDQRGTGKSSLKTIDSTTVTMGKMADDMESLRQHLKIKSWIVFGHSFGGMLASYYTSLHPKRVNKLVLSSSGGIDLTLVKGENLINSNLSKTEIDTLKYWSDKIEKGDTIKITRFQRAKSLAPAYVYNRKFIPVISERLTQLNAEINGLVWNDLIKTNFDCKQKLTTFKNPVLIIQGEQDIVSKQMGELANETFSNSKLIFLEKSRHYPWLDVPEKYFQEINLFLNNK